MSPSFATGLSGAGSRPAADQVIYRVSADLVLVVHLGFIVFVVAGAAMVVRHGWIAWVHLPAAAWGAYVEIAGRICPLTMLENILRVKAGQAGYEDSFIEHYLLPVIYPGTLTRSVQVSIAAVVIVVNIVLYGWILLRRRKTRI